MSPSSSFFPPFKVTMYPLHTSTQLIINIISFTLTNSGGRGAPQKINIEYTF